MSKLTDDYGTFVSKLQRIAAERCQPLSGTFELTGRCNHACSMCYISRPVSDSAAIVRELSADIWIEIARQAKDEGMLFLLLTGGEIFVLPDFFEIYRPLTGMGFLISLYTNATLVTDSIADKLAETPPHRIEVSLYGANTRTYETVTRVLGSFKRCMKGIEALVKRDINVGLKATITRQNVDELDAMQKMARHWGLPFTASWLLTRRADGMPSEIEECRLTPSEAIAIEASDPYAVEEWCGGGVVSKTDNFYCQAGRASFVIDFTGAMNVCSDFPAPGAKVPDIGFRKAWEELRRFVEGAPKLSAECLDCDVIKYCAICPAWSYLENGKMAGSVDYLCSIAHERKKRYESQK